MLVPALADSFDAHCIAGRLDGLLLTGSRSNVAGRRYGCGGGADGPFDEQRDEVALSLAGRMIEAGKPVFGICRGLQELNVLFGGSLCDLGSEHHPDAEIAEFAELFLHRHDIELTETGLLAGHAEDRRISVNSVHRQGIDRLGGGLAIEAVAATDDGVIEAFSCRPCGGDVLAVQWHPEWDTERCPDQPGLLFAARRRAPPRRSAKARAIESYSSLNKRGLGRLYRNPGRHG